MSPFRRVWLLLAFGFAQTGYADIAPRFEGDLSLEVTRIKMVTVAPTSIELTGQGAPVRGEVRGSAQGDLRITIFRANRADLAGDAAWQAYGKELQKLEGFAGRLVARNAGAGTYGGAFNFVSCEDLQPVVK